jgi:Spy/CpxP family protein refolding chaperone
MRRLLMVGALAAIVVLDGAAFAQGPPPGGGGPQMRGERSEPPGQGGALRDLRVPSQEELKQLGLSDAQREQIKAIREEEQKQMKQPEAEVRTAEGELRTLVESESPDAGAIDAQVERIGALRTTILKARITALLGVRSVLTPEQRTQLRTLMRSQSGPPGGAPQSQRPAPGAGGEQVK